MSDSPLAPPKRGGIAADHGGFESKEYLVGVLPQAHHEVVDCGDSQPKPDDDYPDFVVPLARAVARGEVDRGVAICGSGVGACIAANKVPGVRACLIHEGFSARQGVEANSEMLVLRGGAFIGKIRISSVEPATAIGDIITSTLARGVQVQPGDTVVYAGNNS